MPLNPPLPLHAFFVPGPNPYRIKFDQALLPGPLTPANFFVTHGLNDYNVNVAVIVGDEVHVDGVLAGAFSPPEGITYFGAPPEVFGLTGSPAPPFVKIPFI